MPSGPVVGRGQACRCQRPKDAGAALVEASAVLVVIVALVGAVTVVSTSWGRGTSADQLAARAVRMAARVVDPPATDLDVLAFLGASLGDASLERLVIYRPHGTGGAPTSACAELRPSGSTPAGVPGWCTVYGPGHLAAVASSAATMATGCGPGSWEGAWCPAGRRSGTGDVSWIGVVLELRAPDPPAWSRSPDGSVVSARAIAALDPPPRSRP